MMNFSQDHLCLHTRKCSKIFNLACRSFKIATLHRSASLTSQPGVSLSVAEMSQRVDNEERSCRDGSINMVFDVDTTPTLHGDIITRGLELDPPYSSRRSLLLLATSRATDISAFINGAFRRFPLALQLPDLRTSVRLKPCYVTARS